MEDTLSPNCLARAEYRVRTAISSLADRDFAYARVGLFRIHHRQTYDIELEFLHTLHTIGPRCPRVESQQQCITGLQSICPVEMATLG